MFADKLDLMMRLTNTQASTLGRACMLNPSHVSRLRSGARALPKRPAFLHDMTVYLTRRITADYQKSVLCGTMHLSAWPDDEERAVKLVESWFSGSDEASSEVARILASFASPSAASPVHLEELKLPKAKSYYYGTSGKQEAVLQFLSLIQKEGAPQTLYLSSDEETGWLFEDPAYAARWANEFQKVLTAGNQVKIIHHIGRSMDEMLEAVSRWLPLYMTGMIEPFYYPKLRDGVYQRTLFLAPKTAAVVSVSVDRKTRGMLNELIVDKKAVSALTDEFKHYFSLCSPLMQIVTAERSRDLWKAYAALTRTGGNTICMSDLPTLVTMPAWVAKAMQERAPESGILKQRKALLHYVNSLPEGARYTEILPTNLREPAPPELPCADLLGAPGLRYTQEEWRAHVTASSRFAVKKSPCRQVRRPDVPKNVSVFIKEGCGVIVTKNTAPGMAFAFSEANMVSAFWSYLVSRARPSASKAALFPPAP